MPASPFVAPQAEQPVVPLMCHVFSSHARSVRAAIARANGALAPLQLTGDSAASTEIVLAEVLNNIVEHAYADRPGPVRLDLMVSGDTLCCIIQDRGAAMPQGTPPPGKPARLDVSLEDLPVGGFGWFLIRSLTRDLHYQRESGRNRLSFALPLSRHNAADPRCRER